MPNKTVSLRIVTEPGTAKAQLDTITAQADKLKQPIDLKIGAMGGQATGQVDALSASLKGLGDAAKTASDAEITLAGSTRGVATSEDAARGITASLGESLKGLGDSAARVREIEASLVETDKMLADGERILTTSIGAEARAVKSLALAEDELKASTAGASAVQKDAALKTDATGGALGNVGHKASMAAIGVGIVAAASIKMAGDFQQSTNKLVTSAGESTANIGMIRTGMLKLSAQTATTTQELSSGMYMVESAGFHGASGLTVLKAAAQGARAEQAPLATVTNAVTSALMSYHLGAGDATKITNMMVAAVGHGKMTFESFAGSLSTVLPIASAAKLSFAEVGGAIATLTNHGTSADEATQELANTIRSLQAPNNVAVQEMQRLGLSSVDVATHLGQRGLSGTIDMLTKAVLSKMGPAGTLMLNTFNTSKQAAQDAKIMFDKLPSSIQGVAKGYADGTVSAKQWHAELKAMPATTANLAHQYATLVNHTQGFNSMLKAGGPSAQTFNAAMKAMMGGATGLNTALMLGGDNMGTFKSNVKAVGDAGKKTSGDVQGWGEIQKTFNFQMDQSKISAKNMAISFGSALLPAVSAVLKPFSAFATFLASSSAASTTFAVIVGGLLTAVIGTKLVQGFMAAKTAGSQFMEGISKLPSLLRMQRAATTEATVAQEGLDVAMEMNPIGIIIVAVVALVAVFVVLWLKFAGFRDFWIGAWKDIKNWFDDAFKFIKSNWPLILGILTGPIGMAVVMIIKYWRQISDGFITAWRTITGFFSSAWHFIVNGVGSMIGSVVGFIGRLPGQIANVFGSIGSDMYNIGRNIIVGLWNGITGIAGWVLKQVENFAKSIMSTFGKILHIFSPSQVFHGYGQNIVQGLANGINEHAGVATSAVAKLGDTVSGSFRVNMPAGGAGGANGQQVNNININGVVSDPDGVARQIAQLLNQYNRNNGRPAVFA